MLIFDYCFVSVRRPVNGGKNSNYFMRQTQVCWTYFAYFNEDTSTITHDRFSCCTWKKKQKKKILFGFKWNEHKNVSIVPPCQFYWFLSLQLMSGISFLSLALKSFSWKLTKSIGNGRRRISLFFFFVARSLVVVKCGNGVVVVISIDVILSIVLFSSIFFCFRWTWNSIWLRCRILFPEAFRVFGFVHVPLDVVLGACVVCTVDWKCCRRCHCCVHIVKLNATKSTPKTMESVVLDWMMAMMAAECFLPFACFSHAKIEWSAIGNMHKHTLFWHNICTLIDWWHPHSISFRVRSFCAVIIVLLLLLVYAHIHIIHLSGSLCKIESRK